MYRKALRKKVNDTRANATLNGQPSKFDNLLQHEAEWCHLATACAAHNTSSASWRARPLPDCNRWSPYISPGTVNTGACCHFLIRHITFPVNFTATHFYGIGLFSFCIAGRRTDHCEYKETRLLVNGEPVFHCDEFYCWNGNVGTSQVKLSGPARKVYGLLGRFFPDGLEYSRIKLHWMPTSAQQTGSIIAQFWCRDL